MTRAALYTFLFCLISGLGTAQGLCDNLPANAVKGDFTIDGDITAGCSPLNITVIDHSGGTNIKYVYDYDGDPDYNRLLGISSTSQILTSVTPKEFTILQYGDKGGKAMYACQKVTVMPKITYSVSTCNNQLSIQIPIQPAITGYPNYKYKVGASPEVDVANLPYNSSDFTVTFPIQIQVYVTNANGTVTCNASPQILNSVNDHEFSLKITKLEVKDEQNAEITLNGSYDVDYPITLFRVPADKGNFTPDEVELTQAFTPGENTVPIPDASKSYCFRATQGKVCGGTERSSVICTIPLEPIDPLPTQNVLSWENHRGVPIYGASGDPINFDRQITNSEIRIKQLGGTNTVHPFIIPQDSYTHTIDCTQEYCYQVVTSLRDFVENRTQEAQSLSLKRCISRQTIQVPAITDVFASVVDNEIKVDFTDNSGWSLNKNEFHLYQSTASGPIPIADSPTLTPFLVNTLDPNTESQCFKIAYTDQCGSTSELSPEVCTLFLSYDGNALNWTNQPPFSPEAIQSFEIEEIATPTPPVITKNNSEYSETLDLSLRENPVKYRIKAISLNGKISLSNILEVSPTFELHVPTAFSPNQDIHNPTLKVFAKKNMIKDFKIEIYNRFGAKVYTSTDKNFEWDGISDQKEVEAGLYTLVISAQLTSGESINLSEKLFILK